MRTRPPFQPTFPALTCAVPTPQRFLDYFMIYLRRDRYSAVSVTFSPQDGVVEPNIV